MPVETPEEPLIPIHDLNITFVDRLHGWVTGDTERGDESVFAIASTLDGGKTWQAVPIPPTIRNTYSSVFFWQKNSGKVRLLFTDAKNGWLYQNTLFQTSDGGQTWKEEDTRGTILQMGQAIDGFFWVLEQIEGNLTLWRISGDSYDQWIKLTDQFPVAKAPVFMSIIDTQHVWISYWISFLSETPEPGTQLFTTNNGGKNWEKMNPPKPCDFYPMVISPINTQELWIGCGFPGGAGSGISAVYESPDGGKSWIEKKKDTVGYFLSLRALSKSFVYMTYGYDTSVTITYDGGKTWNDEQISCPSAYPQAYFVDELCGWAACDLSINRTIDGGRSWERIDLPVNNSK